MPYLYGILPRLNKQTSAAMRRRFAKLVAGIFSVEHPKLFSNSFKIAAGHSSSPKLPLYRIKWQIKLSKYQEFVRKELQEQKPSYRGKSLEESYC